MSHYSTVSCEKLDGMQLLRDVFKDCKVDCMNFCLFSTSGVHGSYQTIEDAEAILNGLSNDEEDNTRVTFLIVHPRMVCLKYGNCEPKTPDDILFLKNLRAHSHAVISEIGMP